MRTVTYTCDRCLKTFSNDAELITIGSENGQELRYVNNLQERAVIEMNRHSDIHFCSKECFVNYFFHDGSNKKDFI